MSSDAATDKSWYFEERGERKGAFSETEMAERIRAGQIPRGTSVWKKGFPGWLKVENTELQLHLDDAPPPLRGTSPKASGTTAIPDGVAGWSWGAFLLNWIWAIGNRTWIGLLTLVPLVGLVMTVVLGFKGREWAWKNREWDSVEHFNAVQKKWSFWGVMLVLGVLVLGIVGGIVVPAYQQYAARAQLAESEATSAAAATVSGETDISELDSSAPLAPAAQYPADEASPAPAVANPSFDCAKASTAIEHQICADPELADLDRQLSDAYRRLLADSPDPASEKTAQVNWIKTQRNACSDTACLTAAYRSRVEEMESVLQYLNKPADFR